MPEERHPPSQTRPPESTFAQAPQNISPSEIQKEKTPPPSKKTLPEDLLPYLPFWEQPAFQKEVPPSRKYPLAPPPQQEAFSSLFSSQESPPPSKTSPFPPAHPSQELQAQLQKALAALEPPVYKQKPSPPPPSQAQPSSFVAPPQKLKYAQGSFPQPKKLHPLPSSKYIHPSPFDEIYQKYSLPKPEIIGEERESLFDQFTLGEDISKFNRRALIDLQFQLDDLLEKAQRAGESPKAVQQLREKINKIGIVLAQFQQGRGPRSTSGKMYDINVPYTSVSFHKKSGTKDDPDWIRVYDVLTGMWHLFFFPPNEQQEWNTIRGYVNRHVDMIIRFYIDGNGDKIIYQIY